MYIAFVAVCLFFVMQKSAYEVRISDWSSDVCSSVLDAEQQQAVQVIVGAVRCAERHGGYYARRERRSARLSSETSSCSPVSRSRSVALPAADRKSGV